MPLLWLSLAFLVGICLGAGIPWSWWLWTVLGGLALLFLLLRNLRHLDHLRSVFSHLAAILHFPPIPQPPLPYPVLICALCLGAARYQAAQPAIAPGFIAWYNDRPGITTLQGVIIAWPDERDTYTNLQVQVNQLKTPGDKQFIPVKGLLLVKAPAAGGWQYGDRLQVEGSLRTPPVFDDFSYRAYLAGQNIYSYMPDARPRLLEHGRGNPLLAWTYALRQKALVVIYRLFPDPEASLLAGILLGIDSGISTRVLEAFQVTGTAHIIAISGFNITILAALFTRAFNHFLGRRKGAITAALAIAVYTILVGASASVLRAALMGGLSLFARQVGRRQDGLNSLGFVAVLMALYNPNILWDVGFQLSFAATLGLVLYAEPLSQGFLRLGARYLPQGIPQRLVGPVGQFFLFTLAAQVTTLPIVIYHFQRVSLVSLIANPLVLPAQPAVMVLGGLATMLGLFSLPLGRVCAALAWPFTAYTIRAVELLAQAPGAAISLGQSSTDKTPALLGIALFYIVLFGWTWIAPHLSRWAGVVRPAIALAATGALAALVWQAALYAPDGQLHLIILDVGSGDGLLIETPSGRALLIDSGPSPARLSDNMGRHLPFCQRNLDWLVVAGNNAGQIGALPRALERFPPARALLAAPLVNTASGRTLNQALAQASIPAISAQVGQQLDLGEGATLSIVAINTRGAILLLEWHNFQALLPIGLDLPAWTKLKRQAGLSSITALLLPGNGAVPEDLPGWIEHIHPQVILLSAAADDRQAGSWISKLQDIQGYPLLRTDRNGWVELTTDGSRLWVEAEKQGFYPLSTTPGPAILPEN